MTRFNIISNNGIIIKIIIRKLLRNPPCYVIFCCAERPFAVLCTHTQTNKHIKINTHACESRVTRRKSRLFKGSSPQFATTKKPQCCTSCRVAYPARQRAYNTRMTPATRLQAADTVQKAHTERNHGGDLVAMT